MKKRLSTIILHPEPDEGGYSVEAPALPGCGTQGESIGECVARAQEAIALYIEDAMAHGEAVPEGNAQPQAISISAKA